MRKVWLVFKRDFKNIFANGITFIMIVFLLIVPAVFACFIIKASWLPINSSKNVKVALVNKDIGGIVNNTAVNLGNKIEELLKQDTKINWKFLSYDEAIRGVLVGEFYGMLVIPPEFTEGIATFTTDAPIPPKIDYVMNIRENVFIPTFTETSSTKLQVYVGHGITAAINEAVRTLVGELNIDCTLDNARIKNVVEALLDLDSNKDFYVDRLREYRELAGSVMVALSNLREELPNLNQNVEQAEELSEKVTRSMAIIDEIEANEVDTAGDSVLLQAEKTEKLILEFQQLVSYIKERIPSLQSMVEESDEMVIQVYSTFSDVDSAITDITRDLHGLEYKLGFLAGENDMGKLVYILENDPQLVKESIEAPAILERKDINMFSDYGSALAPFNITVAMWIGTTFLVTMLSTRFQIAESKEKSDSQEAFNNLSILQVYFGKGLFFIILSCIQDIIAIVSVKQILGIYISDLILFFCIGIIGSIAFTAIIYTLVSVLGNFGKVITYMLSVLQLFLLGGVFPTQLIPPLFQRINRVLPFIYVIGSLREVQLGIITGNLLKSSLMLLSFTIWSILCGIVGELFLVPYIEKARLMVKASCLGRQDY